MLEPGGEFNESKPLSSKVQEFHRGGTEHILIKHSKKPAAVVVNST